MKSPHDIDHLSHSSLSLYLRCPASWAATYLDERKRRMGHALLKGKAVDAAATFNWRQKVTTLVDISVEDAQGIAEESFYADVDHEGGKSEVDWGTGNFGVALDSAVLMTKRHMLDHAPLYTPTDVQVRVAKRLRDGRDFIGFIDALTDSEIIDVKTAQRKMPQGDADRDLQASAYTWLAERPGRFVFARVTQSAARAHVGSELVTTYRGGEQIASFEELANQVSYLVDDGVYPRIPGWHCSWCPVNNSCPMAGKANDQLEGGDLAPEG